MVQLYEVNTTQVDTATSFMWEWIITITEEITGEIRRNLDISIEAKPEIYYANGSYLFL